MYNYIDSFITRNMQRKQYSNSDGLYRDEYEK